MQDLRDCHGAVWEIIGAVTVETLFDLFLGWCLVVLEMAIVAFAVVAVDCEECWDVWMGSLAVVAFVEVVRGDFPVVVTVKFYCMK